MCVCMCVCACVHTCVYMSIHLWGIQPSLFEHRACVLQSCLTLCDSMDLAHSLYGQASLSHTLTLLFIVCLKSCQTLHDPLSPLIQCRCPPTSKVACPLTVQSLRYFILKTHTGDFPGGPVVETLHCPVKKNSTSFCRHLCMHFFTAFRLVVP